MVTSVGLVMKVWSYLFVSIFQQQGGSSTSSTRESPQLLTDFLYLEIMFDSKIFDSVSRHYSTVRLRLVGI